MKEHANAIIIAAGLIIASLVYAITHQLDRTADRFERGSTPGIVFDKKTGKWSRAPVEDVDEFGGVAVRGK